MIYGLNKDKNRIILLETGELGTSYEDFKNHIIERYAKEGCYALYDYKGTLAFISWIPETMKISSRMIMAASKSEISTRMVGVKAKIEANSEDEIDEVVVREKTASKV